MEDNENDRTGKNEERLFMGWWRGEHGTAGAGKKTCATVQCITAGGHGRTGGAPSQTVRRSREKCLDCAAAYGCGW